MFLNRELPSGRNGRCGGVVPDHKVRSKVEKAPSGNGTRIPTAKWVHPLVRVLGGVPLPRVESWRGEEERL